MIIASNLGGPGHHPARVDGTLLVASVDVEWTKNYRVPNGNRTFCYSVVWLTLPADLHTVGTQELGFGYTSAYVDDDCETREVVVLAAMDLAAIFEQADVLVGHQLSSDLAVLAANAVPAGIEPTPAARENWQPGAVVAARNAWHNRSGSGAPRVVDTRYDSDALLRGPSRRLVDVCGELAMDVTQPELSRKSMTALHRAWLDDADVEARERITVLNLRHSLSAALVATRVLGIVSWAGRLNVNRILEHQLRGTFAWLDHPTFQALTSPS